MLFVSRRQGLCNLLLQDNRVHIIPHFKPAWLLRSIEEFRLPYSVISHSFAPWKLLTTQADICFCRALFGIKKLLLSLTMPQIDFSIDFSPISVWCDLATPKRPPTSHGRLCYFKQPWTDYMLLPMILYKKASCISLWKLLAWLMSGGSYTRPPATLLC